MTTVDVSELAREGLASGEFPANQRSDFRLHMTPAVLDGIWAHAKTDVSVEICGVLVGLWQRDEEGPFASVTDYIRCHAAASKFAEVTFTHESWAQINKEMDTQFADKRIVGWYHSHPDFGIFLSDRDTFIQEHFFSGPGQVAYVVDPVRDLEGVFAWRRGKPTPLPYFWAGDKLRATSESASSGAMPDRGRGAPAGGAVGAEDYVAATAAGASARSSSAMPLATTVLAWMALFLLGYLFAGQRSRWEREMLIEGVAAHYGTWKFLKVGLDQKLEAVEKTLQTASAELEKLPPAGAAASKDEVAAAAKRRQFLSDALTLCSAALSQISDDYALSPLEQEALARVVVAKQAELRSRAPQAAIPSPGSSAKPGTPSGSTPAPSAKQATSAPPNRPDAPAATTDKSDDDAKVPKVE